MPFFRRSRTGNRSRPAFLPPGAGRRPPAVPSPRPILKEYRPGTNGQTGRPTMSYRGIAQATCVVGGYLARRWDCGRRRPARAGGTQAAIDFCPGTPEEPACVLIRPPYPRHRTADPERVGDSQRDVAGHTTRQYIRSSRNRSTHPINDGGDVAFHTRHVARSADQAPGIRLDSARECASERCRAGDFFRGIVTRAQIGGTGEGCRPASRNIAPKQDSGRQTATIRRARDVGGIPVPAMTKSNVCDVPVDVVVGRRHSARRWSRARKHCRGKLRRTHARSPRRWSGGTGRK